LVRWAGPAGGGGSRPGCPAPRRPPPPPAQPHDTVIFHDSLRDDGFAGYTDHSFLLQYTNADGSDAEFDYAQGFALAEAYSFVGRTDDARVYDQAVNPVTGFRRIV
jgi:hypothetical protein